MKEQVAEVVVAGHICLDIIPSLPNAKGGLDQILVPGKLVNAGPVVLSTGGTVSNTGIALHRLGMSVLLMGKIGDDLFGQAVLKLLRRQSPELAEGMMVIAGENTSYSIVIHSPGIDRIFLHCTGANDTFQGSDLRWELLTGARLFHFGYPPLMKRMYADGGTELAGMLHEVKRAGLTTSLDMAKPDPASEAGRVDWMAILEKVLPKVDVFLPSVEEILYMLDRPFYDRLASAKGDIAEHLDGEDLSALADRMIGMGAAIVAVKLGEHGLYLRTAGERRLQSMGGCTPENIGEWAGRELLATCYQVEVAGTTGAGDCTIAGFLAGLLKGLSPESAMRAAVAVGACNVERQDAVSGIPSWETVQRRIEAGWPKRANRLRLDGWRFHEEAELWIGPNDGKITV
ncbi:PfkB domain protein [Thermobacillus xylanilyticus]|uniref:PfkB domain protein n=1 Tax=Thermobacillus xylanilyticus TaxID=76633 RepID=A0ABM8V671_THEXY|nr:carbohydrate kinase family protein [Thermobacillus xylanilyticus]CAG5089652.1 PfkB domain protein [Thermobacillus xylanilyticus]